MAGETGLRLSLIVESALREKGLVDARKEIEDLKKQVTSLQDSLKDTTGTANAFGRSLVDMVAGQQVLSFVRESVTGWAEYERSLNAISASMKAFGINADAEMPRVQKFLETLKPEQINETSKAFNKFIGITHDVDAAMAAVQMSVGAAEHGQIDLEKATEAVTALLQGKGKAAANALGLELKKLNGETKTNAELLDEAEKKLDAFAGTAMDTAEQLDSVDAQFKQVQMTVGQTFAPTIKYLSSIVFHGIALVKDLGTMWGAVIDGVITGVSDMARVINSALDIKMLVTNPTAYVAQLQTAIQSGAKNIASGWNEMFDAIVANHTRAENEIDTNEAGRKKLREQARRNALKEEKDAADKAEKEAQKERDRLAREEEARRKGDLEAELELLKQRAAATREGSRERLELDLQVADQEFLIRVRDEKLTAQAISALWEALQQRKLAITNRYAEAQIKSAQLTYEREYNLFYQQLDRMSQLADRIEERVRRLEQETRDIEAPDNETDRQALKRRQKQEQDDLAAQHKRELDQARLSGDNVTKIEERQARERAALEAKHAAESVKLQKRTEHDKVDAFLSATPRLKAAKDALARFQQTVNDKEKKSDADVVEAGLDVGIAAFPQFKELAIAKAIISTLRGFTQALEGPFPWNLVNAAIVLASGMAQVEQIRGTEPKLARGGIAMDEMRAVIGEAGTEAVLPLESRHGQDMLASAMARAAMQLRAEPSVQAAQSAPTHIYYHDAPVSIQIHGTVIDGERQMRRLARDLAVVQRRDRARLVR